MKRKLFSIALAAALVLVLAAGGWWIVEESGWVAMRKTAPHALNLSSAIERHLAESSDRRRYQCASVGYALSSSPTSGTTSFEDSRFDFNPAAFRVVLNPNAVNVSDAVLPKLQYLARKGLLESRAQPDGSTEFMMTWPGFAGSNEQGCFQTVRGRQAVSVVSWTRKRRDGIVLYEVAARVTPGEILEWVKDQEYSRVFGQDEAARIEPRTAVYELARDERGFTVVSDNGRAVHAGGRADPTIVAVNAQRVGFLDAESLKARLQAELDGNSAPQVRLCLPMPASDETDETDFYTQVSSNGQIQSKRSAYFTFYNLLESRADSRKGALRGYQKMRKLEALGLSKSEELPVTEFKGAAAAGAVRFVLDGDPMEAVLNSPARCFVAGKLAVDSVLAFEQIDSTKMSVRFWARLKVIPAGQIGEKAIQSYGHFKRMAEVGVGMRHNIQIGANGLTFSGGPISQVAFDPDVSRTALPVVVGEKRAVVLAERISTEVPVQVSLLQVMGMSRISGDGLTMSYAGTGTNTTAKSSVARSRGKWYAEATLKTRPGARTPDTYTTVGVARNPRSDVEFMSGVPRAEAFNMRAISQPVNDGETIGIAFNADEGRAHFFRGGRWTNGAPGTGGGSVIAKSVEYVIYASASSSGASSLGKDSWTLNFGRSKFQHPIPPGYLSWDARLGGPGVKVVAAGAAGSLPAAAQRVGKEGVVNRCRNSAGRTVYVEKPCASVGLEQLGTVESARTSSGAANSARTSRESNRQQEHEDGTDPDPGIVTMSCEAPPGGGVATCVPKTEGDKRRIERLEQQRRRGSPEQGPRALPNPPTPRASP